jgi:hypothetical protein
MCLWASQSVQSNFEKELLMAESILSWNDFDHHNAATLFFSRWLCAAESATQHWHGVSISAVNTATATTWPSLYCMNAWGTSHWLLLIVNYMWGCRHLSRTTGHSLIKRERAAPASWNRIKICISCSSCSSVSSLESLTSVVLRIVIYTHLKKNRVLLFYI